MKFKFNLYSIFPKYHAIVEKHFKISLVTIYFDGEREYKGLKSIFEILSI